MSEPLDTTPCSRPSASSANGTFASLRGRTGGTTRTALRRSHAAVSAFTTADDLYGELGANWDLTHLRARLRRYGIRRGPRAKHRQAKSGWQSLTPTETKIAGMVAAGLPNRQIAEQLVLSPRTVGTHVSHILAKLGVRSRIDIAREAAENDQIMA